LGVFPTEVIVRAPGKARGRPQPLLAHPTQASRFAIEYTKSSDRENRIIWGLLLLIGQ
jgi:hypothetical protein